MLEWLIVGGGLHGSIIAQALLSRAHVTADSLRVLDPHDEPLAVWHERTRNCGMRYLRSPAAHAIVPDFTAILGWARRHGYDRDTHTIPPYARPSLELFDAHARAALESSAAGACWVRGTAVALEREPESWVVHTDSGAIPARRVVLAPGRSDGLNRPGWAGDLDGRASGPIHVFDREFNRVEALESRAPVVIGGGVSAVHLALMFARLSAVRHPIRLVTRHEIRVHQFDSDPCYIGPACMKDYLALVDPEQRRSVLNRSRNPGSIPPDLRVELDAAAADGRVEIIRDEIGGAERRREKTTLRGSRARYESDLVVLATGLASGPPAGELLGPLVHKHGTSPLPVDSAGYPVPRASLEWSDGLYVTGALGEQELGPSATNIIGAHNAAKRIIAHLGGAPRPIPSAWRRYGG